jgi:hypothetical protein
MAKRMNLIRIPKNRGRKSHFREEMISMELNLSHLLTHLLLVKTRPALVKTLRFKILFRSREPGEKSIGKNKERKRAQRRPAFLKGLGLSHSASSHWGRWRLLSRAQSLAGRVALPQQPSL